MGCNNSDVMNYLKTNPKGIDIEIQSIQEKLYDKLNFGTIDGYGRIYTTINDSGETIPEYYISKNEYKEVLTDDRINGHFFFVESDTTNVVNTYFQTNIDIIFLLDLKKIKPTITHRADEEVRVDINAILKKSFLFEITNVTKGIDALDGFDTDLSDMQPYHFLKFTGVLQYQPNC